MVDGVVECVYYVVVCVDVDYWIVIGIGVFE